MTQDRFDVAVIGAGPGGYTAAIRSADLGASVALVECGPVGGACLNVGCIPTKAMLHASELFHEMATTAAGLGIHADNLRFELAEQVQAKDRVVARLRAGLDKVIAQRPIHRFHAFARLAGPGQVELFDPVDRSRRIGRLAARRIILATGGRPIRPAGIAFDESAVVTTDESLSLTRRPDRVLILGGGVIGCEQATFFSEIGSQVTVVEALERIVPMMDEDLSKEVAKGLKKRKVRLITGQRAASVVREGDLVAAVLADGTRIETDLALVAIGRQANTDGLGLETVGLAGDGRACLPVDDRCRTAAEGLYAVGDVTGVAPYAHAAFRQGEIAAANATGGDQRDDMKVIPACVFTHPSVATVGLSEGAAALAGRAVKVARFPLQALGLAQAQQRASGWIKILAEPDNGRIVGAAAVAPQAVELIHELALAVRHELTVADVAATIHAHPTYSEAVKEAADHYLGLPIHGLKD